MGEFGGFFADLVILTTPGFHFDHKAIYPIVKIVS